VREKRLILRRKKHVWKNGWELPNRESRTKTEREKQNRIDLRSEVRPQVTENAENFARLSCVKRWPRYCIVKAGCIS